MTQLLSYIPQPNLLLFCDRKGLHQQQPLDLICLHPLCRNNPLACSVCFDQIHKFHKVVPIKKFLDDYNRNTKKLNKNYLHKQIITSYKETNQIIKSLRQKFNKSLDIFQNNVDQYKDYLINQMNIKYQISKQFGVEISSQKIQQLINLADLRKSLQFLLNNSSFDQQSNMIDISELLKSNNQRILALASKLEYMTMQSERNINQVIQTLKFAPNTIKQQKITTRINLDNSNYQIMKSIDISKFQATHHKPKYYKQFRNLVHTTSNFDKRNYSVLLDKTIQVQTQASPTKKRFQDLSSQRKSSQKDQNIITFKNPVTKFRFLSFKNQSLSVTNKNTFVKSTINASIPQYILAQPHLQLQPMKISKWSLKILKCRNLSCLNTVAIGISHKKYLQKRKYEVKPNDFNDGYLVNSQGDMFLPTNSYKDKNFRFSEGDTIHFKYDPFYNIFEMKKQNGQGITLKTISKSQDPLYICVRLTYASDQVQIIN